MRLPLFVVVALLLSAPAAAQTTLIDRGNGLIYDPDQNITWLQNADAFGTGAVARSWDDAMLLVSSFIYLGISNWRLPTTPGTGIGVLAEGELGYLYYQQLRNVAGGIDFVPGPFVNIRFGRYWTATTFDAASAFAFYIAPSNPMSGVQDIDQRSHGNNIWVVHDGDVASLLQEAHVAPEPAAVFLVATGLIGLAAAHRVMVPRFASTNGYRARRGAHDLERRHQSGLLSE